MKITFNKASHCIKLSSLEEASNAYGVFVETYCTLRKEKGIPGGIEFLGDPIDILQPITSQGHNIYDLRKCWEKRGRDQLSLILTIFSSLASGKKSPTPYKLVFLDNVSFRIPSDHSQAILFSLETAEKYTALDINVNLPDGSSLTALNISCPDHIKAHRIPLGIRIYQRNPKHKSTYSSMGNGLVASPMDLSDAEAQDLLNSAIQIDKDRTLYASLNGKCYVFPEHEPGKEIYHGYLEDQPSELVKHKLCL